MGFNKWRALMVVNALCVFLRVCCSFGVESFPNTLDL